MNPILALWAVPRSRSTAFSTMMAQRGDFAVRVEPFEACAYYSDEQVIKRFRSRGPKWNYGPTLNALLTEARNKRVFIKDHAYYIAHLANTEFLSLFRHSFLIRHPAQALPSFYEKCPTMCFKETGYRELSELFDRVVEHTGEIPPLIDADDLMQNPEAIIGSYCDRFGIPYIASALKWRPRNEGHYWHDHLFTTTGFQDRPNRPYFCIEDNEHLKRLYDRCLPYYEKLYQYRLPIQCGATNG